MNLRIRQLAQVAIVVIGTSLLFYSGPIFLAAILGHAFFSGSRLAPFLTATYGLLAARYVAKRLFEKSSDASPKQKVVITLLAFILSVLVLGRFFFAQLAWLGLSLVGGPLTLPHVLPTVASTLVFLIIVWTVVYHLMTAWKAKKGGIFAVRESLLDPIVIFLSIALIVLSWLSIFMEPVFDLLKQLS